MPVPAAVLLPKPYNGTSAYWNLCWDKGKVMQYDAGHKTIVIIKADRRSDKSFGGAIHIKAQKGFQGPAGMVIIVTDIIIGNNLGNFTCR